MPRKTKHPGLRAHSWRTSSGEVRTAYYLDNRGGKHQPDGPAEIPLGTDHAEALRQWTALALLKPLEAGTLKAAFDEWERDVLPTYRASTRRDYGLCLTKLRDVFEPCRWADLGMPDLKRYLQKRGGKTLANRELALLSIIWNWAILAGQTKLPYPAAGLSRSRWKNAEAPRALEPTPAMFDAVYAHADQVLRDAMDIIAATGLRVRDAVRVGIPADGILRGQASKTGKRFAIDMSASPTLAPLLARRRTYPAAHVCLLSHPSGAMVAERHLTDRFARARAAAVAAHPKLRDLGRMILCDCRKLAAEAAPSLSAAADLLQHDDQRLTRAHYRRGVVPLKTVR